MPPKKPTTTNPPNPPREPFNVAVYRLVRSNYLPIPPLAGSAGMQVGKWNEMMYGVIPYDLPFYDAAVSRFPQLSVYTPPVRDHVPVTVVTHPAVVVENERFDACIDVVKRINPNRHNRQAVAELCNMARNGRFTLDDQNRLL